MNRKFKKTLGLVLVNAALVGSAIGLAGCGGEKGDTIMVWGPKEHEAVYTNLFDEFYKANPDFKGKFEFASNGDAGAYANMTIDPEAGAGIYTFPNDQLANMSRLGAIAPILGDNLTWAQDKNTASNMEAGKIGENYYAYPVQGDNGYYMYFNKDAFKDTQVWDATNGTLKSDYTFRDLYNALDERAGQSGHEKWANGKVTWAMGDSWYVSGVFFAVGGDYSVTYDDEGNQTAAKCWFGYEGTDNKTGDYTIGLNAITGMINSINTASGKRDINPHYMYTDGDKASLNDNISKFVKPAEDETGKTIQFAAMICGTWKANEIKEAWGDDYACTYLPMLECNDGMYRMKNFRGYKLMGVNPLCKYAQKSEDNLQWLHKAAQFFSDKDSQIARYQATGAGPSNKEALEDESIKADAALVALNAQYDLECTYPAGATKAGQAVGNGKGYRNQDSVPANYWTPIQAFGNALYTEIKTKTGTQFSNDTMKKLTLAQLQLDIENASK